METGREGDVFPGWFERPGAPEAVVVGADIRGRYGALCKDIETKREKVGRVGGERGERARERVGRVGGKEG